nr:uncharacterized protein LOC125424319 isoform X6 [Ziziphus jujuba var. spinosa]XP_048337359.1 uncharacterized protein LOC125424319 isoform X6 [Ziziphus jujuba var. spinosa]XP_048337360.1 uncharacterized protein LOC125424319 isoform X6 [Ziziphus jujuba var. spinosa]
MVDYQHVIGVHRDVSRRKKRNWMEFEEPHFSVANGSRGLTASLGIVECSNPSLLPDPRRKKSINSLLLRWLMGLHVFFR